MDDFEINERVDALQIKYLQALDGRDMHRWLECFDPEGSYICTSRENEQEGLPLGMMLDDSGARLKDRVKFVTQVWAGTFEDYATRHFVQRLCIERVSEGLYSMCSSFMVAFSPSTGGSQILTLGEYRDEIVLSTTAARFKRRRAVLDTVTLPRYLVYPI